MYSQVHKYAHVLAGQLIAINSPRAEVCVALHVTLTQVAACVTRNIQWLGWPHCGLVTLGVPFAVHEKEREV